MEVLDSLLARLIALLHPLLANLRARFLSGIRVDFRMAMDLVRRVNAIRDGAGFSGELRGAVLRWGLIVLLGCAALGLILSLLLRAVRRERKGGAAARLPYFLLALPYLVFFLWLALSLGLTGRLWEALAALPDPAQRALLFALAAQSLAAPHRFAMRRPVSAVIQTLGALPLALGAYQMGRLSPMSFAALSDEVIAAVLLLGIGAAFLLWRLTDVFLVLFGGLSPAASGKKKTRRGRA